MTKRPLIAAAILAAIALPGQALARDTLYIAGSSTVHPFASAVVERFGAAGKFPEPRLESVGTGGGFALFCAGVGAEHPDISNASRAIKPAEFELCESNGAGELTEVKIGYDGLAVANSTAGPALDLSLAELWLALAKSVPDPDGGEDLIANPYQTWQQINPDLPDVAIEVLGPPPTSGTRDSFVELAMEGGCQTFAPVAALKESDEKQFRRVCHDLREDGAFVEAGENDLLIVYKLDRNPNALGVFGYSFLDQHREKLQGVKINGVMPDTESIASGEYPLSRPLFFYVKQAHIGTIPGIAEYVAAFTSDDAWGPQGYLVALGLIPLPDEQRTAVAASAQAMETMTSP